MGADFKYTNFFVPSDCPPPPSGVVSTGQLSYLLSMILSHHTASRRRCCMCGECCM